ncbi:ferric reductase transmembrane component 4 [Fusarium beomiforme]|uniref:Ferric reductase transmembrane component 4 n=1 Tax=Fusarium beomiforme TaxID=44412 RepID=A0A9P5ARR3_9HYPO|nr:ferric reductase transmembrane component 4 [Fusarium beomiforme]
MSLLKSLSALLTLQAGSASALGLTGYGLTTYDPICAQACLNSFTSLMLSCSSMHDGHMATPPACRANDTSFLTSMAWCMSEKCAGQKISKLEGFWEESVTGSKSVPAKWTYTETLMEIDPKPPRYQLNVTDKALNHTSTLAPFTYLSQYNSLWATNHEMMMGARYGIILVVIAVGLPILMTWAGYLPLIPSLYDKFKPYILYPSMIGTYSVRPLPFKLGNAPTIGQGLYIALFISLAAVFTGIDYQLRQPHARFIGERRELLAYLVYRTGALAFATLPVIILFPSRNNLLLWLTNWSRSTFILLHRWIGRTFALLAVLHAIFVLVGSDKLGQTDWRRWGSVTVIFTLITCFGSGLYVRKANYEMFLIMHILIAALVIVGCWYHLMLRYASIRLHSPGYTTGHEIWLYLTIALWGFERLFRIVRILRLGILRSKVKDIGAGYVRVDVPSVRWGLDPGKHVFVYFPTLATMRPWENHPFSVIPTVVLQQRGASATPGSPTSPGASSGLEDIEKSTAQISVARQSPAAAEISSGVTLFIKKSTGITKYLESHDRLLTFLEGPYPGGNTRQVLRCDRLLLIAGGVGITSLFALIHNHWNVKLAWSVKADARCLVNEIEPALDAVSTAQTDIRIGSRFDIAALIDQEASAGWKRVGIVVSGPGSLCDDVRAVVAGMGRHSETVFELEVDAYSW